jgi:fatty-acyl-CoA synthase
VRGRNLMCGYWNDSELTAQALLDGWFHSGDIGHLDEEGFLFVDGRIKEVIVSGGENIFPAPLEAILAECPGVREAAIVGRPDERWGEVVIAVVVREPGSAVEASDVLAGFAGRIARYKHPRAVVFVGELPRNALGKVTKDALRRMVGTAERGEMRAPGARAS